MQHNKVGQDLPRFTKDFIGIGHQLEKKRKDRRKVQLEERAIANRVLFLQKEEIRAEKSFIKKREELSRMMTKAERQALELQNKERLRIQRQRQIELTREQNKLKRILHRQSKDLNQHQISRRNSIDYELTRKKLIDGERRKQQQKREQLAARKERYMTVNLMKEQGRSRIDKFYQLKNREHTSLYKEKIKKEEGKTMQKIGTIKKLQQIQSVLRKRLQQSSMRVSKMDEILGKVGKSIKNRSLSKSSLSLSLDVNSPTLITTIQGQLLSKRQQVQQKIQQCGQTGGGASEGSKVRKRRRNKHANRYQQYELF